MIYIGHETSANLFSKIPDINNRGSNLFEIDRRAKTAMTQVGKIHNTIQKFDYRPQYSDVQSQRIFSKVKEHLILKHLDNENQKKKFIVTKKLFDVFLPIDEEDYKLEDLVKQSGIKTNQALFKKRKSMLVVDALHQNKDKSKHKEALADILKNINDLKDTFLHKPKPVKVIKQTKAHIDINKDLLKSLRSQSKNQFSHFDLPDEKKEVDIKTISRLSSPKRMNTKSFVKVDSLNNAMSTPKKNKGPNDKINEIFTRMMSGSINSDRNNSPRLINKNSFRKNSSVSTPKDNFKINLESVNIQDKAETIPKSPKLVSLDRESNSEKSFDKNDNLCEEDKNPLKNKYLDKRYSVIISEKSSYSNSSQKEKVSMEGLRFNNKQSFITDSKLSSDYFKDQSMSIKDSFRSNEKEKRLLIDEVKNKKKANIKNDVSKHENCKTHSKSNNKKTKRQSYLNILKL